MSYSEKLKDPRWQKKRLEVMQRDEFTCQMCGETKDTLNVHHIAYQGDNPWDTNLDLLITLCKHCHEFEGDAYKYNLSELTTAIKQRGIMSNGLNGLIEILSTNKDRGWIGYSPMYSIIAFMIDDDELWEIANKKFLEMLRDKNSQVHVNDIF